MIEKVIKEIPQWQGKKISYTSLSGGITNLNYKVDVDNESFVVCISGAKTSLLGIDRDRERTINEAVAKLGIAPQVVHATDDGHLVTRFIEGKSFSEEDVRAEKNIERIAKTIRKFHALSNFTWKFCSFRMIENYAKTAKNHGAKFPPQFTKMIEQMNKIEKALSYQPQKSCLCHNDLLSGNFIDDGNIRIIDWEYAGVGDPFFDTANLSTNHVFTDEHDKILLNHYLGKEPSATDIAHHNLMKIMSYFREAMWAQVQMQISTLDEDFESYRDKHFDRMSDCTNNEKFEEYLKTVS